MLALFLPPCSSEIAYFNNFSCSTVLQKTFSEHLLCQTGKLLTFTLPELIALIMSKKILPMSAGTLFNYIISILLVEYFA